MTEQKTPDIRILIADDEVEFATTLETRLKLRKYEAATVHTGEDAIEAVERDKPDILLLDLKMPDLDGLEVLAKLRENNPDLQVIILTGHGSFGVGKEGMELGAYDYFMKPVELTLLIQTIEKAVKAGRSKAAEKKDDVP